MTEEVATAAGRRSRVELETNLDSSEVEGEGTEEEEGGVVVVEGALQRAKEMGHLKREKRWQPVALLMLQSHNGRISEDASDLIEVAVEIILTEIVRAIVNSNLRHRQLPPTEQKAELLQQLLHKSCSSLPR